MSKPMKTILISIATILITSLMATSANLYTDVTVLKTKNKSFEKTLERIEKKVDAIHWHLTGKDSE